MKRGVKPRGPFANKKRALTTRITEETRAMLEADAEAAGRSLSQEIELRLVRPQDMTKREFMIRYMLNGALSWPDGMEAAKVARGASEAWGVIVNLSGDET